MRHQRYSGKFFFYFILILFVFSIYAGYLSNDDNVVPVWSSHDREYYELDPAHNIIYWLTDIRLRVPVTYLKREFPYFSFYQPKDLPKPGQQIYNQAEEKFTKLEFELGKSREDERRKQRVTEKPVVLIYHTHTSETYSDDPRRQDNNGHVAPGQLGNVTRVGKRLASILSSQYNYQVIHSTEVHDQDYGIAYQKSRQTVKKIIQQYDNLVMLIDIHRNGIQQISRDEVVTTFSGKKLAKLMFVVGKSEYQLAGAGSLANDQNSWRNNLNLTNQIAKYIEKNYPAILQRVEIKNGTYNQDLHANSILVEVGDYLNTTAEALRTIELLAKAIDVVIKRR